MIFVVTASILPAQTIKQKHVPSIVVNAFQLKFPKATDVGWELERGFYKVEFKIGETDHEAWLDYMGKVKKQKRDMEENELPKAVKASIEKTFNGFEIHNVERFEEGKNVIYKMKLEKSREKRKVIFNPQGKILEIRNN